jgi:NosR/NirI family nitrous oxide reductase transcriptional regulator
MRNPRFHIPWRVCGLAVVMLLNVAGMAHAVQPLPRFPQPEFESGYVQPSTAIPPPRAPAQDYADVVMLVLFLVVASWLVLKRRSRAGLVVLSLLAMAYFGFYRRGCVCPVGSIQNVAAALGNPAEVISWTVVAFFLLPLVFAALFGRVFCAGVCPLGVLQDLVVWKPVRLPAWLDEPLRLLPPLYLGLAVLMAVTGADYIICRYDPFIGFYRLGGTLEMLMFGAVILLGGMFVGRLYCRFLCPYGVLLGWISKFAYRHATITPGGCINCRLCEQSCPFDCIRIPEPDEAIPDRHRARRSLGLMLALVPLLVLLGAGLGLMVRAPLSRMHPEVRLAERVAWEEKTGSQTFTVESETFRASGRSVADLAPAVERIRHKFGIGSACLGGFVGLLLGVRLVGLFRWPRQKGYDVDRAGCMSCARCFEFCSVGPELPANEGETNHG